jgi:ribosomal protein S18 acetylase RimI-like enzyme
MPIVTVATDAELDAVVALVNSAYRGDSSRAGWTTEADYLDGQRTDVETLRADLASHPGAVVLVMREKPDGELLGSVWLEPNHDGAWHLGMLTVRPTLQSQGLGRTLLREAESFAAGRGARQIRLSVFDIRDTLVAWYERQGFRPTGELLPFYYGDAKFGVPLRDDLRFMVMEKSV